MNPKQSLLLRTLPQSPHQQIPLNPQTNQFVKNQSRYNFSLPHDPFEIEILRVQTRKVSRFAQKLFALNQEDLNKAVKSYTSLPYSPIDINQLSSQPNCRLIKSQGSKIYIGQTRNKKKHGKGVAIYGDGKIYQGTFQNNRKTGFGVQYYTNGNFYIGDFKQNQKHGSGMFYWFNLTQISSSKDSHVIIEHYKGEWWGGIPDGKGQHHRSNGDIYVGEFRNGLKHGKGIQKYANGDQYDGEFINGLSEGNGRYKWSDGSQYDGDFKQGYRNGYGIWTSSKSVNQKYQGHYILDKKHGYGVYDFGNGFTYKGAYIQDQRNGQGSLYHGHQLIYQGYWVNGSKVSSIDQTTRRIQLPSKSSTLLDLNKFDQMETKRLKQMQTSLSKQRSLKKQNLSKENRKNQYQQHIQYCIEFKRQSKEPKARIGHRNCIPCQQRKQLIRRNEDSSSRTKVKVKSKQDRKGRKESANKQRSFSLNKQ